MNAALREALDRTLLLMRDDLVEGIEDFKVMDALTCTRVVLVGDARNLSSHAAQTAYITAALLMARSGHRVYLAAPDVPLIGAQPPLKGDRLVTALLDVGSDLLPTIGFSVYAPRSELALEVLFGDSQPRYRARRTVTVNAGAWSAHLGSAEFRRIWMEHDWPFGALAAGALAAVEAFKAAMHQLRCFAKDEVLFDALFAFTDQACVELARESSPKVATLGNLDFVSGGAITNASLYALARLPGITGFGRIVEPETGDLSNLNRYSLMRRSAVNQDKAAVLAALMSPNLKLESVPLRFEGKQSRIGNFAPLVLVGVDDIPTRWEVQARRPHWLGVGATTHWAAMASFHQDGLGCARCLHPRDDPAPGRIPTVAFVTFFSGLTLAAYMIRELGGERLSLGEQYTYFSPLRPEHIWRSPVAVRDDCPLCDPEARRRVA